MDFDFDAAIERRGTQSSKWDNLAARTAADAPDAIAMWTADMDFRAAPPILDRLREMLEHGIFGYYAPDAPWREAACLWAAERHGWEIEPGWITRSSGVCAGIAACLQAFSAPGEGVVVFAPVYHAFAGVIRANGRRLIESPLRLEQGRYRMDLERFGADLPADARIVLLCNPHNPGGTVWRPGELRALADFCAARGLILVADEIWRDIVFAPARFTPTARAAPEAADRLVALTAPSKTFNLAGGTTSEAVISDPALRARFAAATKANGGLEHNWFGPKLAEAAYRGGAPWLDALLPYVEANLRRFEAAISEIAPGARAMPAEATYLSWVDFSGTGLAPEECARRIGATARIGVSAGPTFGLGGESRQRFNLACPRATVETALDRLSDAFADLR